jgi:alpha-L-rhamnosidase
MTSSVLTVKRPRCEYRVDPLGIDDRSPRLSWALESEARGERQSAYRVLVARGEEDLGAEQNLLWYGGGGESYRCLGVEDGGKLLRSGSRFTWMGPLLGGSGNHTPCGVSADFETGLPESSERKGAWVSAGVGPGPSMGQGRYEFAGRR